jgi:hypothetical protein
MKEFRVTLHHKAGELARLADLIGQHELNLRSVCGLNDGHKAIVCLVCDDVAGLRTVLSDARIQFEEHELLSHLMEDSPGQLAGLATQLGEKGVNLHSLYILARDSPLVEFGFTVDDPKKAKAALGL